MSNLVHVPVPLKKVFPEFVDWVSASWVYRKQREELSSSQEAVPIRYPRSLSVWQFAGVLLTLAVLAKLWRKKS
ncbi:MAG: hypothetical protein ACXW4Q_15045 [Anaerolineales bacterium]